MKSYAGKRLPAALLRKTCDPSDFSFGTTAEIDDKGWLIAQDRALEALSFGAEIEKPGFNIYVISPWQAGHLEALKSHLETLTPPADVLNDWAYVHNFEDARRPKALRLPPGTGRRLKGALEEVVAHLRQTVPMIFDSDEYRKRVEGVDAEMQQAVHALQQRADDNDIILMQSETGLRMVPAKDGRPMSAEDLDALSDAERAQLEALVADLQDELESIIARLPEWERQAEERIESLNHEIAIAAVEHILGPVRDTFAGDQKVSAYLEDVHFDMVQNIELFAGDEEEDDPMGFARFRSAPADPFFKYRVNLIIDRAEAFAAPVVLEDHPTYGNIVGKIEQSSDLGAPPFDFTSIQPGVLHKAAGGFVLIDVEELVQLPLAWEALKRSLKSGKITIDTLRDFIGDTGGETLEPEPIPVTCKIVLIGDRFMHYRMTVLENDFAEQFRVVADFNDEMDRTDQSLHEFAGLVGSIADRDRLNPFDRTAVARLVEEASRYAEDAEKLSLMISPLAEIMAEADHYAGVEGRMVVSAADIDKAVEARTKRNGLLRDRSHEYILREFINVRTDGVRTGQINGLVVTGLNEMFGRPSRITARVRMGYGQTTEIEQIVDIQREVEMGGSSHSKGVMLLGAYLRSTFSPELPLSLSATLAFEQSYSFVDGDSASTAELCALLSAIGNIPLKQSLAITGALSQLGEVQTIGGVNEKIEGFYDICLARGLTGKQGVIIPERNMKDLMLRQDVVEAVEGNQFHIYAVATVDQAMALLTGMPAGERGRNGLFPKGTINRAVEDRLLNFARARMEANRTLIGKKNGLI